MSAMPRLRLAATLLIVVSSSLGGCILDETGSRDAKSNDAVVMTRDANVTDARDEFSVVIVCWREGSDAEKTTTAPCDASGWLQIDEENRSGGLRPWSGNGSNFSGRAVLDMRRLVGEDAVESQATLSGREILEWGTRFRASVGIDQTMIQIFRSDYAAFRGQSRMYPVAGTDFFLESGARLDLVYGCDEAPCTVHGTQVTFRTFGPWPRANLTVERP
ncbi:MAG: hypothetical protein ACT4PT_14480 [Methanobacteriota archaeon]